MFAGRQVDLPQMMAHLREVAAQLSLDFGARRHTYNSRLAQELGKWAEEKGCGPAYHLAVFKAYFADGHNIADTEILLTICSQLGLSRPEASAIIENRTFREQVDSDWQQSRQYAITAVPTFRLNRINLVGAQPYEKLAELLESQQVSHRSD